MIDFDDRIESMLLNVLEQTEIILRDFSYNGQTHYDYVLEKLTRAKHDLDVLINIAENKREEVKNK